MRHNFFIIPSNHLVEDAKTAVIILPEIFGHNDFIEDMAKTLTEQKIQPIFLQPLTYRFAYEEGEEAHTYFYKTFGYSFADVFVTAIGGLKKDYQQVGLLGFSVGATLAWLICKNMDSGADFVIGFYGSRIRDFLHLQPCSPTLLLFAQNDSFVLEPVVARLREKPNVNLEVYPAAHGFVDHYGPNYNQVQAEAAKKRMHEFISLMQKDL
ncbi:MAG: hypothetical protein GX138_05515 [Firmicutes bacterium]|jgi:dienelactone hydrolase|nr:hypothetical protein [Bacillota bacterium]